MKHSFIALILLLLTAGAVFSQKDSAKSNEANITQMTVMVIPRVNLDQDIRTVLDQSDVKRIAVAKIKEAFDRRGFRTIDFVARLNASKTNSAFMSSNPADAKTSIIENSSTDLVVEVDVMITEASANLHAATVPIQCFDAASGVTLGISMNGCQSPNNQTTDMAALVSRAINEVCLQKFLNSLNDAFEDLRHNGRAIKLLVRPSASSKYNLLSKVGSSAKNISALVTEWLDEHTVKGSYTVNGSSKLAFDADNVKIPLLDARNKNYKPFLFGNDLVSFLMEKGISGDSEVRNGNVYITIN